MNGKEQVYTPDEMMMPDMKFLVDFFRLVTAEQFIDSARSACQDYTIWRKRMFDDMSINDVFKMVDEDTSDPFE